MMNSVEKEIPEEPAKGRFHEKLLTHVELRWTRPLLVFERLHTIVERLVVGVERLNGSAAPGAGTSVQWTSPRSMMVEHAAISFASVQTKSRVDGDRSCGRYVNWANGSASSTLLNVGNSAW